MLKRLRIKFVAIMMSIFTVMLVLIFALILHFTHQSYIDSSIEQMRSVAMEPFVPDRPDGHRGFLPFPHFVLTADRTGKIIGRSGVEYFDLSDTALLQQLMDTVHDSARPDGIIYESRLRFLMVQLPNGGTRVVFMDAGQEFEAISKLLSMFFPIGLAALAVFWGISVFIARLIVKPVDRAWEQQRQFVADASHELKTPLAVITTNAELLNSPGCSPEEKAGFSENVLTTARHMRQLVENLLELARADNGALQLNMGKLELSEMVTDVLLPFEPLYFENGLTLESSIESGIVVKACEEYLRQVPEILLDNAIKYSSPGSTVFLKLEKHGGYALLSVANEGPSLSAEELENIFKRFYRVDKTRGGGSYGLGLPIAESIVTEHKGKIWVESVNGVNTFKVKLPM